MSDGQIPETRQITDELKRIGSVPEDTPHELLELLATELDEDPQTYFDRKDQAQYVLPILDKLTEE